MSVSAESSPSTAASKKSGNSAVEYMYLLAKAERHRRQKYAQECIREEILSLNTTRYASTAITNSN
eukprot:m.46588 g.46588  ORF g.46588 m.46588 type:complete len:66 (+) comp8780_c0_seq1:4232-4429(+)